MPLDAIGRFFLPAIGVPDEEISDARAFLVGVILLMVFLAFLTLLVNLAEATQED